MLHGIHVPYLQTLVLCIFMDMAREYNKRETNAVLHFGVCEVHNPSLCTECNNIYRHFKRKNKIVHFHDIYSFLSVSQKFSSLLYTDREYFIRAFMPLVKKEGNKYNFKKKGLHWQDLEQEGYAILLYLFNKSEYRETQPARFTSYIQKTFPLLLLQAYIKMRNSQNSIKLCSSLKTLEECAVKPTEKQEDSILLDQIYMSAKELLTDTEYNMFLMHYDLDYSIQDIASALGLDNKYIINSLYCSREKIKEYLVENSK